jgi:AraC-like DNA-binding protein
MANLSNVFLKALCETVEKHMDDPDLDVKKLTRLLGMSRTDLHRKITLYAGMSITAYIRKMRLEKASCLLRDRPEICVSSIMRDTGFSHHSYFTKRFKEMFGMCPDSYRKHFPNLTIA